MTADLAAGPVPPRRLGLSLYAWLL